MSEKKGLDIMEMFGLNKKMDTETKILPIKQAEDKPQKKVNLPQPKPTEKTDNLYFDNHEDNESYIAVKANIQLQQAFEIRLKGDGKKHTVKIIQFPYVMPAEHQIEYDGIESTTFVYGTTTYTIKGINLKWFRQKLREQKLEYIQEFDSNLFTELPQDGETIIAQIEVLEAFQKNKIED